MTKVGGPPSWQSGISAWFDDTGADTSIWSDISGNGFHVQQATAGSRPTIDTAAQNGLQARGFTTGRSLFRNAVIGGSTDYSVAMVVNTPSIASTVTYLRNGAGSTGYRFDYRASPGNQVNFVHSGIGDIISTSASSGWKIVVGTRRTVGGNKANVWSNGVQLAFNITTGMNAPATTFTIGGTNNVGQMGEVIITDREWTTTEVAGVISYLNTKWAVF